MEGCDNHERSPYNAICATDVTYPFNMMAGSSSGSLCSFISE